MSQRLLWKGRLCCKQGTEEVIQQEQRSSDKNLRIMLIYKIIFSNKGKRNEGMKVNGTSLAKMFLNDRFCRTFKEPYTSQGEQTLTLFP